MTEGLQIRCIVEGVQKYLDTFPNETLEMNISFAEIQDITKKNSTYSKQFNLPGSKKNNDIFNYFFEFSSTFIDFNPKLKFEAEVLYNGYEILTGYIRLNSVNINKTTKVYNITFYNGVGDLASNIKDKFLYDLDLSSLNHPFDNTVIEKSQYDPNLYFLYTGAPSRPSYPYEDGRTFFGLYNLGYEYTTDISKLGQYYNSQAFGSITFGVGGNESVLLTTNTSWKAGDGIRLGSDSNPNEFIIGTVTAYNPATFALSFDIVSEVGTGTENTWNIELFLPNAEIINNPLTPQIEFATRNDIPNFFSFSGTPIQSQYLKASISIKELYTQIVNQAGYNIESSFFNTSYFEKFYLPLKFGEGVFATGDAQVCYSYTNSNIGVYISTTNPSSGITCNNFSLLSNTTQFAIPNSLNGTYTFNVILTADVTYSSCPSAGDFTIDLIANSVVYNMLTQQMCDDVPGNYQNVQFAGSITVPITGATSTAIEINLGSYGIDAFRDISFQITNAPSQFVGNFDYAKQFPPNDYKQIDFITSVNKMFNFVVIPSPDRPKTLIIEPIIDYIGKGEIIDWTGKVDYDSTITVEPTTNYINGTIFFNNRLDKDFGNQQFNISSNRIFGSKNIRLSQEFKDNITTIQGIFSSDVDITILGTQRFPPSITIPNMAAVKIKEINGQPQTLFEPFKVLPKTIFRGLMFPTENYSSTPVNSLKYYLEEIEFDKYQLLNRFTTYPFNYNGFSHYTNYNSEDFFDANESVFPYAYDLIDIYYSDYLNDLISNENKILSLKIYLEPYEIANLHFNEKILIENNYYRVNKINYNLIEPGLCDVQLVKLTRDYTPHPVLYYKLSGCTGGEIYTNSDLNYNLFAYIGNYVKVYTGSTYPLTSLGCYSVSQTTYNAAHNYQNIYIGTANDINPFDPFPPPTNIGVGVYDNCACTGTTQFIINVDPEPEPPLILTLLGVVAPGSVNVAYTLTADSSRTLPYTLSFVNTLSATTGPNIVITTGITMNASFTTSTLNVSVPGNFGDLALIGSYSGITISVPAYSAFTLTSTDIFIPPTPTPTPTPTNTITPTITSTPTNTITPTVTPTNTITPTNTLTPTPTITPSTSDLCDIDINRTTPSITATPTITPTITPTKTITPSITPTNTITPTPTITPTTTITPTNTITPSITPSITPTTPSGVVVDYLVVAGGGGGGRGQFHGAGGGAGGMLTGSSYSLSVSTNYTVTIGAGGAGGNFDFINATSGNTSLFSVISTVGGGRGGSQSVNGGNGGSGGGCGRLATPGLGTAGQGFNGGQGFNLGVGNGAGGGGGASAVGADGTSTLGGNGGNGLQSSITGSTAYYAGGGGGSVAAGGTAAGSGGLGGGGNGSYGSTSAATSGVVNTGGGGGGAERTFRLGGAGGSGIVVIKYPDTFTITVGAGLTSTETTSGGFKIRIFTAGTGTISFSGGS